MRKKIAAILTTCFTRSHAEVILPKLIRGFPTDDGIVDSQLNLVSIYLDQIHEEDVCLPFAQKNNIPIYPSIVKALTLGGKKLAVDGVLIIGEHGDYASNEKEQKLYPRRFFFEQVCGLFSTSGHSVPVFNDKHLSYSWDQAKWMYDRALELKVPLMAGSSLPVAYRNPWLEYELETPIEEALSIAYGGLDAYGFHALELLQCMIERRKGGETGIARVQCIEGDKVWEAERKGWWSRELATAAEENIGPKTPGRMEDNCDNPVLFLLEYADGLRAASLMLNGHLQGWGYAGKSNGKIQGMEVFLHGDPHPHFVYMGLNIQEMFLTGKPPYPVERTLLISGALDALMESRYHGNVPIKTPHLNLSYRSYEQMPIRPAGARPIGSSAIPWRTEGRSG
ncbi:MAG: hypothetical protein VX294_03005 [Candidatus Latescibacterota bacterium]|nr:hypothetical protein [Candidatus Latescibacterota bacterium]